MSLQRAHRFPERSFVQHGKSLRVWGDRTIRIKYCPSRPGGRRYFFGAQGLAALVVFGAHGFAALSGLGAHGLAAFVALGAQGFAACATADGAVKAASPPSAAMQVRVASEVLSDFITILLCG
jgi:hypothetical protein